MKKTIFRIAWAAAIGAIAAMAVILGCTTVSTTGGPETAPADLSAAVMDRLVSAYEQRDVPGFMTLVSARYLGGYEDLQTALEDSLKTTVSIELDVRPERIWESEDGMIFMDAGWSKTITRRDVPGVEITFGRVTAIFIRYKADVIKLFAQKGDPVFP